ncbi:unannotated protein [freshwater metagenome]|uniref:Unannotated protein n=1 Tax=freshwater metagenome TaxID=449393 RepID=A0A6J6UFE5_9ZZZZ|nr:ABC transporter permease subunit [Actinomycetota bacterium]
MKLLPVQRKFVNIGQNYALTFGITAALWECAALTVNSRSFPHLNSVLLDLLNLIKNIDFWKSLIVTFNLTIIGFVIGALFAFALGLATALNKRLNLLLSSSINFLRSIPSVVFLPLLVASIGASARTAIILTALVVSLKLVIFVSRGVLETEMEHIEFAKIYHLSTFSKICNIYIPSLFSVVSTGFRLSASRAFGTVIASGIIIGTPGLGRDLLFAESNAEYERVFSYVIILGIVGTLIYATFNVIERQFIHWRVNI